MAIRDPPRGLLGRHGECDALDELLHTVRSGQSRVLVVRGEARPLVCVIDDAQWLDRASRQALAFVARRLLAERIAVVFAVREPSDTDELLAGLPELVVDGLGDDDARTVLASGINGPLDPR